MNILGINAYHGDASAALLTNGHLTAAVEEERFNRIKHWAGFPTQSAQSCLKSQDPSDVHFLVQILAMLLAAVERKR